MDITSVGVDALIKHIQGEAEPNCGECEGRLRNLTPFILELDLPEVSDAYNQALSNAIECDKKVAQMRKEYARR